MNVPPGPNDVFLDCSADQVLEIQFALSVDDSLAGLDWRSLLVAGIHAVEGSGECCYVGALSPKQASSGALGNAVELSEPGTYQIRPPEIDGWAIEGPSVLRVELEAGNPIPIEISWISEK